MPFPTNTEITTIETSTYNAGTNTGTGYMYASGNPALPSFENPAPVSKIQGFLTGVKQLLAWCKGELDNVINKKYIIDAVPSANQATGVGFTKILFQTAIVSRGGGYSSSRYTAQIASRYSGMASVLVTGGTSSRLGIQLLKNGTDPVLNNLVQGQLLPASAGGMCATVPIDVFLNAGDWVEVWVLTDVARTTDAARCKLVIGISGY